MTKVNSKWLVIVPTSSWLNGNEQRRIPMFAVHVVDSVPVESAQNMPLYIILIILTSVPAYVGIGYGVFMKMEYVWGPYPEWFEGRDNSDYYFALLLITIFFPLLVIGTLTYKITCALFDTGPVLVNIVVYLLPFLALNSKDTNI
jgi:hypothetical protein